MADYVVPGLLAICSLIALHRRENTYDLLLQGGREGLKTAVSILPALVVLLTAVHMLKASGAMELLSGFLAPVFRFWAFHRKRPC